MKKFLILGLGRIGRNVLEILLSNEFFRSYDFYYSDKNNDINNYAYLLNYDGIYKNKRYKIKNEYILDSEFNKKIKFYPLSSLSNSLDEFSFILDTSGSLEFISNKFGVGCPFFVSHTPNKYIDKYVVPNINENEVDLKKDKVISMSICDTTAIAPIVKKIDQKFKILNGHITTLHPWLNYQNLSGNHVLASGIPNSYWKDYSLGRKSTENLIPKTTTAVSALEKVLPEIAKKLTCFSYRVPTPIVSSAVINLKIKNKVTSKELIHKPIIEEFKEVQINEEPLISSDFSGNPSASIINSNFTQINDDIITMMIWYDNEFGYSSQYVKSIEKIIKKEKNV